MTLAKKIVLLLMAAGMLLAVFLESVPAQAQEMKHDMAGMGAEGPSTDGYKAAMDKMAADFHGEVVTSDQVKMRDLPTALQQLMLPMQVGQATQPFGSIDEGIRTLVICGRDEVAAGAPSYDEVFNQLNEERVNMRARRYLRDLRRDAVIEFR